MCDHRHSRTRRARATRTRYRLPALCAGILTLLALLGLPALGLAHYPWLMVHIEDSQTGAAVRVHTGHAFPEDEPLPADRLSGVVLVRSEGAVEPLQAVGVEALALPGPLEGTMMLVAEEKPAYWSRTFEGGRAVSREEAADAFSCSQTLNVMKAALGQGSGTAWRHRQGHPLELLPLNDPAALRPGDPLSIQVLFHGDPWQGELKATYAGFQQTGEEDYALTVRTNAEGVARFVPAVAGYWLVRAYASEAYPDPVICDRRAYHSTLTFAIR